MGYGMTLAAGGRWSGYDISRGLLASKLILCVFSCIMFTGALALYCRSLLILISGFSAFADRDHAHEPPLTPDENIRNGWKVRRRRILESRGAVIRSDCRRRILLLIDLPVFVCSVKN